MCECLPETRVLVGLVGCHVGVITEFSLVKLAEEEPIRDNIGVF